MKHDESPQVERATSQLTLQTGRLDPPQSPASAQTGQLDAPRDKMCTFSRFSAA